MPHAGEAMKDTANMPALIIIGLALVAFAAGLAALRPVILASVWCRRCWRPPAFIIVSAWLVVEHRRVRRIEDQWHAPHPDAQR
jgi:hypothetical protein